MDFDYTFRSTSHGINNIAPVQNRFGDEFLIRELGFYIYKPLDPKCWDWGFNALILAGADGSFDLADCSPGALLARSNNKRQTIRSGRYLRAGCFDHIEIFALIQMNAFTSGTEGDIANNACFIPLSDICFDGLRLNFTSEVERRGERQKYSAELIHPRKEYAASSIF